MRPAGFPDDPPVVAGRYKLYTELATGGMGTVYLGRLLGAAGFSRTVAVKRLHPQFAKDAQFVAMFTDEARLAARIRHPNVVQTFDVVSTGSEHLLVMEYVQGESLRALWRAARDRGELIPQPVAVAIVTQVLEGLHAAHEATGDDGQPLGIIHRDVSPQNVLVGGDGVARVLDFGIAKATGNSQNTDSGVLKGKLSYMAPEQVLRERALTRAVDVYAAGIVLWELLTGRRLFDASSEGQLVLQVAMGSIESPQTFADVSPELDAVTLRALAREPKERFATAHEMARALGEACRPATQIEVSDWVKSVAGDGLAARAELVAEIERSSSRMVSAPERPIDASVHVSTAPEAFPPKAPTTAADGEPGTELAAVMPPQSPPRWRAAVVSAVVAAVLTGSVAVWWTTRASKAPSAATPPPPPPATSIPPAASTPPEVSLPIVATPPTVAASASASAAASASAPKPARSGSPTTAKPKPGKGTKDGLFDRD